MRKFFTNGALALAGLVCLLPATGSASTLFTLTGEGGASSTSVGTATIYWTGLLYGSTFVSDSYKEVYSWTSPNSATLTITAVNAASASGGFTGFSANEVLLTINETGGSLLPNTSPDAVNLYSGVSSLSLASNFKTDLGLSTLPPVAAFSASNFSVTGTSGTVTSAIGQLVVTPEPSSLSLFTFAMLAGLGVKFRGKRGRGVTRA